MRKIACLLIILILSGCALPLPELKSKDIFEYMTQPEMKRPEISGTWKRYKSYYLDDDEAPIKEELEGSLNYLLIDEDFAGAFHQFTRQPSYESKIVNANNYIIQKLRQSKEALGINKDQLKIVKIRGVEKFNLEIIVLDNENLLVTKDGYLHYYENISKDLDEDIFTMFVEENQDEDLGVMPGIAQETVLGLGIRQLAGDNINLPEYKYKTYFIHFPVDNENVNVYTAEDIYIPRGSVFWKIEVDRIEENDKKILDKVSVRPYLSDCVDDEKTAYQMDDNVAHAISYVDSQFISMENIYYTDTLYTQYETYTFESFDEGEALDISIIAGEKGKETMILAAEAEANQMRIKNGSRIVRIPETDEWGIGRRNGRWIFKSIVRALDGNTVLRKGFELNLLTFPNVFNHNLLEISWRNIKEIHPLAIDAMSSPNGDYLIIQEEFYLFVYRIEKQKIAESPSKIIRIHQGDVFVMGEWVMGSDAQDLLEQFKSIELLETGE